MNWPRAARFVATSDQVPDMPAADFFFVDKLTAPSSDQRSFDVVNADLEIPRELFPDFSTSVLLRYAKVFEESKEPKEPKGAEGLTPTKIEDGKPRPHNEEMNAVSREELDAKLEAMRSDVRAGNADLRAEFHAMRADMASIRTAMTQDLAAVVASMGDLKASAGEVKGSLDGVKTSLNTVQWLVGTLLAAAALYVAVAQLFSPAPAPVPVQPQPVVITIPSTAAPVASETTRLPASRP